MCDFETKVSINRAVFTVTKKDAVLRDLLSQSQQGGIDSGCFELVRVKDGRIMNIDEPVDTEGEEDDRGLMIRQVELPDFWAGQEWTQNVRGGLIATVQVTEGLEELHAGIVRRMREAGYRAVGFHTVENFRDSLDRLAGEKREAVGSGLFVTSDSVITPDLRPVMREWERVAGRRAFVCDMLRGGRNRELVEAVFAELMPATNEAADSLDDQALDLLCHGILVRFATDASPDVVARLGEVRDEAIQSVRIVASLVRDLTREAWRHASRSLVGVLETALRRDPVRGLSGMEPSGVYKAFEDAQLWDVLVGGCTRTMRGVLERYPIVLEKGFDLAHFRQVYG